MRGEARMERPSHNRALAAVECLIALLEVPRVFSLALCNPYLAP